MGHAHRNAQHVDQGGSGITRDRSSDKEVHHEFIRRINFTQHVKRQLEQVHHRFRKDDSEHLKYIKTDKDLIKEFLREKIGSTFQECTVQSDENLLEVDSATWGGMRHMRENTPWKQMERSMKDYRAYVRDHLGRLCHWHRWQ